MDGFNGINNSDVHNRSSQSPIHSYPSQNPYYHHTAPVVDPYASPDGHTTVLNNLNSPYLRYLHSSRPLMASPMSAGDHSTSFGYHRTSESSSRIDPPRQPRSPVIFGSISAKVEEDVLVMDGFSVKKPSVDKSRSSSASSVTDSGGSSSSVGRNYKKNFCVSYLENSGYCRYGSKCQFAHGNKELRSSPISYKSMLELPCTSYNLYGTCLYGSKCRYLHSEISSSTSTKVPTSTIKQDEVTSNIVKQKIPNWYPMDDNIEIKTTAGNIASNEVFDAYVNHVLYGPRRNKFLPVFSQICRE